MKKLLCAISVVAILAIGMAFNAFALENGFADDAVYNSIVYGNGIYVIVRDSSNFIVTKDGFTGDGVPFPDGLSGEHELMFIGEKFLLFISNRLYASSDAVNWKRSDYSGGAFSNAPLFVNGRYLLFAEGGDFPLFTSADALSWERSNYSAGIGDALFAFGKYFLIPKFAEGENCAIYTSDDSVGWQLSFEAPAKEKVMKVYPGKALVLYLSDASLIYTFDGTEYKMKKIGGSGEKLSTLLRHEDIYLMDTEIEGKPGNVYISGDGISFDILEVNGIPQTGARIESWRYNGMQHVWEWQKYDMDVTYAYRYAIVSEESILDDWNIRFIATNAPGGPFGINELHTDEWEDVLYGTAKNSEPKRSVYIDNKTSWPRISYDGTNYRKLFAGSITPSSTATDQKGTWISIGGNNALFVSKSDFVFEEFIFEPNRRVTSVEYENGIFWILTSAPYLYSSADGISWEEIPLPAVPKTFAWDGEKYLVGADTSGEQTDEKGNTYKTGGIIFTSIDGINWNNRFTGKTNFESLTTEGPAYVAVGQSGFSLEKSLAYSLDTGNSWIEFIISDLFMPSHALSQIVYGARRYVAAGVKSYTSRDGVNWVTMNGMPESDSQCVLRYQNDMFIFGSKGRLYKGETSESSEEIKWSFLGGGLGIISDIDFVGNDVILVSGSNFTLLSLSNPNKKFPQPKVLSGFVEVIKLSAPEGLE
ncbi:MAG: hypothetical protein LBU32_19830 [Clostridiales bacterium]|jgi:hypothetical protein|nr:hypothetical protein [Clostridiales bacterium]